MAPRKVGYSDVLIGLQYGDEGKAKIIDALAPNYNIVARFNGGVNAGHTVVTDRGVIALRQVPSAIEYPECSLYIGSGCVISPGALIKEINSINAGGYSIDGRLKISPHATLVLPHHVVLDRIHGDDVGTTGNGIGPAYADRAFRMRNGVLANIRMEELIKNPDMVIKLANQHLKAIEKESGEFYEIGTGLLQDLEGTVSALIPFISHSSAYLVNLLEKGGKVLFEGAQSYMLDVVHGDVPYVTSSHTSVSAAYTGGDAPPRYHRHSFGIVKLVMSRVGRGPFPSEFGGDQSNEYCTKNGGKDHTRDYEKACFNADELIATGDPFKVGQALRMLSGEYGTGSGRPRRIGMLDVAQLRSAVSMNGINYIFLTKCDCLRDFSKTPDKTIPVVTHYDAQGRPAVNRYAGFDTSLHSCKAFSDLPKGLGALIQDIETLSGAEVLGIGVGPHRDQMVMKNGGRAVDLQFSRQQDLSSSTDSC